MEFVVQEQPCYQLGEIEIREEQSAVEVTVPMIGRLTLNDAGIRKEKDGSMIVESQTSRVKISASGEVSFSYKPHIERQGGLVEQETGEGQVSVMGTVEAAPKQLADRNSPLAFFLIEETETGVKKVEVWATSSMKAKLKALGLKKGDVVEATLFREVIQAELMNHNEVTLVRHRLLSISKLGKHRRRQVA